MYFYATGSVHALNVKNSYMVKALGNCKALFLAERAWSCCWYGNSDGNGGQWVHQRKVITPEFFTDNIKVKYWEYSMHGMQTILWKQATPPSIGLCRAPLKKIGSVSRLRQRLRPVIWMTCHVCPVLLRFVPFYGVLVGFESRPGRFCSAAPFLL